MDHIAINQRAKSSCEILESATLAAYYKFDSPNNTISSSPNPIASSASSVTTHLTGYRNQAISFAGTVSSYFQISGLTAFGIDNQPFSISLWVQPTSLSGSLVHLSSTNTGTGSHCFSLLGFDSSGSVVAQVMTSAGTVVSITGPVLQTTSTWTHIVQTWSSTNGLRLYVNRTLAGSITAGTFSTSGTTPNYLSLGNCVSGCSSCSTNGITTAGPYTGAVDEWRIYTKELASGDICALSAYT